jgi:hypothetical protein
MSKTTPRHKKRTRSLSTIQATNDQPLPSQLELATLAAALDKPENTPATTAARALAVWTACVEALEKESLVREQARELLARLTRFRKGIFPTQEFYRNGRIIALMPGKVPLLEFLKSHFSKNSKPAHQLKKFRDFVREIVPDISDDEETVLKKTANAMQSFREYGVRGEIVADLSLDFEEFLQRQKREMEVERARKGGIARREKAEKIPQRKKTLGSKKTGPKQKKAGRKQ